MSRNLTYIFVLYLKLQYVVYKQLITRIYLLRCDDQLYPERVNFRIMNCHNRSLELVEGFRAWLTKTKEIRALAQNNNEYKYGNLFRVQYNFQFL